MIRQDLIERLRVPPGKKIRLEDYDPGWAQTKELKELGKDAVKARSQEVLAQNLADLAEAQELLYANDVYSVLVCLQAMDAAGKDGTIKHVMTGVNPQGVQVFAFKAPSAEELDHNFLWRYMRALPERGRIGIFNRSYYEDVLVVRVHPELLERQKLPPGKRGQKFWKDRYEDINAFERHLVRNGTLILKFFLNVSKDEQKKRFLERLDNAGEALEVLDRGPRRAGTLGRVHRSVRGRAQRHQHRVGAVVRGTRRQQVGDARRGGGHPDVRDPRPRAGSSESVEGEEARAGGSPSEVAGRVSRAEPEYACSG